MTIPLWSNPLEFALSAALAVTAAATSASTTPDTMRRDVNRFSFADSTT
jgi:hypothetical protein